MTSSERPSLVARNRAVTTPFGLLGSDESALTAALGFES